MFSNAEIKCIQSLFENKQLYLLLFKGTPEHEILSHLYASYATAFNKFGINILQATPIPTKPLNAYVVGGMASGVAGIGAGVVAFQDAKSKEQKYEQSMLRYNSTLTGIERTCDELAYYYGCIVNLINTNPKAAKRLKEIENEICAKVAAQEEEERKGKIISATVISVLLTLIFGVPIGICTGSLLAFICVAGITFSIAWICAYMKM